MWKGWMIFGIVFIRLSVFCLAHINLVNQTWGKPLVAILRIEKLREFQATSGWINVLPVREKWEERTDRFLSYLINWSGNETWKTQSIIIWRSFFFIMKNYNVIQYIFKYKKYPISNIKSTCNISSLFDMILNEKRYQYKFHKSRRSIIPRDIYRINFLLDDL